ncbi:MAG: RluA family pseudouridine synthase [Bryobacterales bacterium]|nr:RluA family pseudouridine synthase [Bryobacterales bacterium]
MTIFEVRDTEAGRNLRDIVLERWPALSRMYVRSRIARGGAFVNGQPAVSGFKPAAGAVVTLAFDVEAMTAMHAEAIPLEIVHEDPALLVVVKPAGMLAHPARYAKQGTLANGLVWHLNRDGGPLVRPIFVHRLDRETSGLLVVAKTLEAARWLSRELAAGCFAKRYTAVVSGHPRDCTIEAPIGRDPERRPQWGVLAGGKSARTLLRAMERGAAGTLVEMEPVTGRTNQLRIHCAHIGHPVVGDTAYGGPEATRLFLHAASLGFRHPNQTWMSFESPAGFRAG